MYIYYVYRDVFLIQMSVNGNLAYWFDWVTVTRIYTPKFGSIENNQWSHVSVISKCISFIDDFDDRYLHNKYCLNLTVCVDCCWSWSQTTDPSSHFICASSWTLDKIFTSDKNQWVMHHNISLIQTNEKSSYFFSSTLLLKFTKIFVQQLDIYIW
jgi:hypothetical protein